MLKVTMRPSLVNIIHQPQEKTQLYFLQFACKKRNTAGRHYGKIKEIASLSGFSTLEYLSRAFAAATGVSPTVWRERNVKNA